MGVEEPGLRDDGELRAQVWRVFHVGDGDRGTAEMPARVGRVLQVSEAGERGLAQFAGRNARWSTCRSCARWGSPGAPLSIGCRTGVEALRALLKAEDDTGFTRSEAERILRRPIAAAKLEAPVFNTYVTGLEADAVGPVHRVAIDVDGFAAHGHQAALERDRARDNALVVAGCLVLRFTWRQLTREPMVVLASIVQALTVRIHTNLLVPKTVGSVQT